MKATQRGKHTIRTLFFIVCAIAIVVALFGYPWHGSNKAGNNWKPTKREPEAKIIFNGKWGQDIGFHRATGKDGDIFDYGFSNFCIKEGKIYIADTINEHISTFTDNKLLRVYNYSKEILHDVGLAATDGFIFLLDNRGYISKIDIESGEYLMYKHVVENPYGSLTENEYTIYELDRIIVINDDLYMNKCLSSDDLTEVKCPFVNQTDPYQKEKYVYLPQNYYASIVGGETVWLHDATGKKIGRVAGINENNVLYDIRRNYQVELNGVYYLKRSDTGVTIYYKPWER